MLRSLFFALTTLLLAASAPPGQAFECNYCEGKDPARLIELSVSRSSPALRAQIRRWVAENYPETGAGYTARAWVAASNGASAQEVERLYREAIKRDPSIGLAYNNLAIVLEKQERYPEAFEFYKAAARAWPEYAFFVQFAYFNLKNGQGDPVAARAYLEQAEREGVSERWVYDFVRGIEARGKDNVAAVRYFQSALDQGGNHDALKEWINAQLSVLGARQASPEEHVDALREAVSWGYDNRNDVALRHVAKILADDHADYSVAFDLYSAAYRMNPSPEAAARGFGAIGNGDFVAGLALLERGLADFPNNEEILSTLNWAYSDFSLQPDLADQYGRRAIAAAPTLDQLTAAIHQYTGFVINAALYDQAVPIYERYLSELTGGHYRDVLGYYVDNRIAARDFGMANRLMDQVRDFGGFSENWIAVRHNRISTALRLENQRDRYYDDNPFLKDWEDRFGDSLRGLCCTNCVKGVFPLSPDGLILGAQ